MIRIILLVLTLDLIVSDVFILADLIFIPFLLFNWNKIVFRQEEIVIIFLSILIATYQFFFTEYWVPSFFINNFCRLLYVYSVYIVLKGTIKLEKADRAFKVLWFVLLANFVLYVIYPNTVLYSVESYGEIRFKSFFYREPAHFCLNFSCILLYAIERKLLSKISIFLSILILVFTKSFTGLIFAFYFLVTLIPANILLLSSPLTLAVLTQIPYVANRFIRVVNNTDFSSIGRTIGMLEGFVYIFKNGLILGVGLGQVNSYLLFAQPDFKFWFSPVLYGLKNSGITNGILTLVFSLGILGLFIMYRGMKGLKLRYLSFVTIYMASISNIISVAFVFPILVVSLLNDSKE